jgi:hypothetical protein
MSLHKSWNVRDQTEEELQQKAGKLYKDIEKNYKLLKRLSNIEDAKKMIDSIWNMKAIAHDIQQELLRREYLELLRRIYTDGTQNANK